MINREVLKYYLQHLQNLVFEVTDLCNLDCKYCGFSELYRGYDKREGKMLSFEKARLMIDYVLQLRKYPLDVYYPLMVGFYGGEPLLNMPLIQQVVEYIENKPNTQKFIMHNMTTNAVLLDKYMDYLVEKQFFLLISLDGDETGQSYRVDHTGKNSFDRVFQNVQLLREKYPDYFQTRVGFIAVLHRRNSVESILRFIKDTFGKVPTISALSFSGINEENLSEFNEIYQNFNESYQNSLNCEALDAEMFIRSPKISNLLNYIHRQSGNMYDSFNHLIFNQIKEKLPTGTCIPFSKKLFVTVNGKILPCEKIGHDIVLGNVLDDRVELFDLDSIAENHNRYISKFKEQCNVCGLNEQCPQCVYYCRDIHKENVRCSDFCSKEKSEQYLRGMFDYLRDHPSYYAKILQEVAIKS